MAGRARAAFPFRDLHSSEIFIAGDSDDAHRTFRKLAQRTEDYFSAATGIFCPHKKEGKRPGLNQYHFPGCVLEVIKILDVSGGKRLPEFASSEKSDKRQ
jgi:hypothetical protein